MNLTKFVLLFIFSISIAGQPERNLVLTEIMFKPAAANSEFIELYNPVNNEPVNLKGMFIRYQTSSPDLIISSNGDSVLQPGKFAVIFEGDYDFVNGIYKIPDSALVMMIDNKAFGSSGMSNSSDRTVYLLNSFGDTLTFYTYSADNPGGISDEKIILNSDNTPANWANSVVENGTPGSKNSVSPVNYDAAVTGISINPQIPLNGDTVIITADIANLGINIIQIVEVKFYNDINLDSLAQSGEEFYSATINNLSPSDTVEIQAVLENITNGEKRIIVEVLITNDENGFNNKKSIGFKVTEPAANFNDIVINEIMYRPESGSPEWIELYNGTGKNINIANWGIKDKSTKSKISREEFTVTPNEFLILSESESINDFYKINSRVLILNLPSLNNSGDEIVITDSLGRIIDSVEYKSSWGGSTGKSLERIEASVNSTDSANWSESVNPLGATPGFINSVTPKDYDVEVTEIVFSPPFPFFHDTVTISAKVKISGKQPVSFRLHLLEDSNLDSLTENIIETSGELFLESGDSLLHQFSYEIHDVTNNVGFAVKAVSVNDQNPYNDSLYTVLQTGVKPGTIVINEIMYLPENGEPEWIELYNNSGREIDLFNWSISDVLTNPVVKKVDEHYLFPPGSYLVISKSSSIYNFHRIIPAPVIELGFANLNNDSDGIVLKDDRGITIDSVFYNFNFSSIKGFSLEKIKFDLPSNDFENWLPSVDLEQSTPGRINSQTPKEYDLAIAEINIIPRFPVDGDEIKIGVKIYNRGSKSGNNFSVAISAGKTDPLEFLEEINVDKLNAFDSVSVSTNASIRITDTLFAEAQINYPGDEDFLNNNFRKLFVTGYKEHSVLISEVMFNPTGNQPEWIEFYNNSPDTLNLKRWSVAKYFNIKTTSIISYEDSFIEPSGFFVIAKDTSAGIFEGTPNLFQVDFGKLNNRKDSVKIFDFRGAVIDSMNYSFSHTTTPGISLERISYEVFNGSGNWAFSLNSNGNTLGKPNSLENANAYSRNSVIINEIMFEPDEGRSEYVELLNISGEAVEFGNWILKEGSGKTFPLCSGSKILPSGEYFLIAADSSVLSDFPYLRNSENISILNSTSLNLSNTSDEIVISDLFGNTVDSVKYNTDWHNSQITATKNKALERINPQINSNDPSNWSTCVLNEGGTPLKQNSIFTGNVSTGAKMEISPNPFSPDNDGFEDFALISYNLTQTISQVRIRIFDSKGRKVRTLVTNKPSGAKGEIIFNGLDDNGNPLRTGIYIILLEALNPNSAVIETVKKPLVVARKF